jgi:hypothetical protein
LDYTVLNCLALWYVYQLYKCMHKIQTNKQMNGFIDNKRHPFKQNNQMQFYII